MSIGGVVAAIALGGLAASGFPVRRAKPSAPPELAHAHALASAVQDRKATSELCEAPRFSYHLRVSRESLSAEGDPIPQMVYALKADDVRDVMVNGRVVVSDTKILTLDEGQILQEAGEYRLRVSGSLK